MVSMRSALRAMLDLQIIWESSDVDEAVKQGCFTIHEYFIVKCMVEYTANQLLKLQKQGFAKSRWRQHMLNPL